MKNTLVFLFSLLVLSTGADLTGISKQAFGQSVKEPFDYVNPFIGTINYGATNPGAVAPLGMVSVVPFNVTKAPGNVYNMDEGWCSTPYWHDNEILTGFSHVNFSSVGCPDLGSILLMPTTGDLNPDHRHYGSAYFEETAYPGYYRTILKKHGVIAEMTATPRSGRSRYHFPAGESHILVNLGLGLTNETGAFVERLSETEIQGFKLMGTFCYNPQDVFPVYFAIRVSKAPQNTQYWKYHRRLDGDKHQWSSTSDTYKVYSKYWKELAGEDIGVIFTYETRPNEAIEVQVGISYVSTENAWENLDTEQHNLSFDQIREQARYDWSQYLNTILVEGGTEEDREMFYTAFYHTLLHPNIFNDINGQYPAMGTAIIKSKGQSKFENRYTMFSLWDTYRTVHPLKCLLFPDQQLGMVSTMLDMYRESGALPKWEFAGQNYNVMEGDPALIVISDTYNRGLRDFDTSLAWEAMHHHAFAPGDQNRVRPDNDFYKIHHYVPITRPFDNSVSQAVEYYAADYALSQFARAIGETAWADSLHQRSLGWTTYFDPAHGLLRPVTPEGTFYEPFDPLMGENFEPSHGFHEGTSWNYSFALPHDIQGMMNKLGGPKAYAEKLITSFEEGRFDMTNEPDIGYPWYFNFVKGQEEKTQHYVDYCINTWFSTRPDGLPGNDDAGTLSSWLMYAMMGIYPVIPGEPVYALSAPRFKKITIRLDPSHYPAGQITIETDKDPVKYRRLKEKRYFITHEELTDKGLKLRLR